MDLKKIKHSQRQDQLIKVWMLCHRLTKNYQLSLILNPSIRINGEKV